MTDGEKLEIVREEEGLNQKEFSKKLGFKEPGFYSDIKNGKSRFPPKRYSVLAEMFGVNLNWFVTGEGEPFEKTAKGQEKISAHPGTKKVGEPAIAYAADTDVEIPDWMPPSSDEYELIPLAEAHLSAGGGAFVISEKMREHYAFRKEWLRRIASDIKSLVLMRVRGSSMMPTIQDGDFILIDTGRRRIHAGGVYAVGLGETIAVKRLEPLPTGSVRLISNNRAEHDPFDVRVDELRVLGQVVWFARQLIRP